MDGPERTGRPCGRSRRDRFRRRRDARDGARPQPRAHAGERRHTEPECPRSSPTNRLRRALDRRAERDTDGNHVPVPQPGAWGHRRVHGDRGPARRYGRPLGHLPGAGLAREQGHDPRPDPGFLREPRHRYQRHRQEYLRPIPRLHLLHLRTGLQGACRTRRLVRDERSDAGRQLRSLCRPALDRRLRGAEADRAARTRGVLQRLLGER